LRESAGCMEGVFDGMLLNSFVGRLVVSIVGGADGKTVDTSLVLGAFEGMLLEVADGKPVGSAIIAETSEGWPLWIAVGANVGSFDVGNQEGWLLEIFN